MRQWDGARHTGMLWRAEKVLNWTCGDSYQNDRVVQGMNSVLGMLLLSKAISLSE